jgi:hypothetical protein
MKMKKAKSGSNLGMKSVKAGYDKNPGVTRADIIVAAKKQAKSGTKMKKAQLGLNQTAETSSDDMLRRSQYKRLGRLSAKNPRRAKKVAERMTERATREARGKKYMTTNLSKLTPSVPTIQKKGGTTKKMKTGGTLSPSKSSTSTRLSTYGKTIGKNTMGKAKSGTSMKKCKYGCK